MKIRTKIALWFADDVIDEIKSRVSVVERKTSKFTEDCQIELARGETFGATSED